MKTPDSIARLVHLCSVGAELLTLPVAKLCFRLHINPGPIRATYRAFTKPHPRFKIFKNKSMGIALIDLSRFEAPAAYLATVRKRGYAADLGRKAKSRGYSLREINRNDHVEEIYQINTSSPTRQGRPMDRHYLEKKLHYDEQPHFRCFGAFNAQGKLVAYCNVGFYGNFAATDQLLGYKNRDGVMYLLLMEIICRLIEEGKLEYFMYDTFLGAQAGLRDFKRRIGFRPYRVRYDLAQA
jgi:hypothetical protein